jgi:DNA-directed RNA polymerase subunit M
MMSPKEEKGKKYLLCSCGYNTKKSEAPKANVIKEVVKPKHIDKLEVVSEQDTTLPLTEEQCPECGHEKAYWWTKQMRASDEPETKFLKCEKCKHTWRDRS